MRNRLSYFLPLFVLVILFLIDWYVFQGVETLAKGWESFQAQQRVKVSYWLFSATLLVGIVYGLFNRLSSGKLNLFSRLVFHTFIVQLVSKLVFLTVLLGEDIFRTVFALVQVIISPVNAFILPGRTESISQLGLLLAGIPFATIVYGIVRGKYNYKVHRHILYFKDLPEAFHRFTITQISDIHSGSFKNSRAVQRGINLINEQNSDLFVFTGDLVNNVASEIEPWLGHFSQINAPYGKFSILGNHDYGDYVPWRTPQEKQENLAQLKQYHDSLGHRLLLDEHVTIEKDGYKIFLAGVENWGHGFAKKGNLNKAVQGITKNDFTILLSHDPSHWDAEVKNHVSHIHLTLSGHTHGMQFGIEVYGFRWSPVKYRYPNWAGMSEHFEKYLHVNRGFGFLGFEGRVGIWPEITVIELRKS